MIYTKEMAKAIRAIPKPYKDFKVGISDCGSHLEILTKESEVMAFSQDQRANILEYLTMIEKVLNSFPGTKAFLAGVNAK